MQTFLIYNDYHVTSNKLESVIVCKISIDQRNWTYKELWNCFLNDEIKIKIKKITPGLPWRCNINEEDLLIKINDINIDPLIINFRKYKICL